MESSTETIHANPDYMPAVTLAALAGLALTLTRCAASSEQDHVTPEPTVAVEPTWMPDDRIIICDIGGKTIKAIAPQTFDPTRHSTDLEACDPYYGPPLKGGCLYSDSKSTDGHSIAKHPPE